MVLADGETGYVRAITADDAPQLLAFHERQPRENLYRRFFSPKPTLSPTPSCAHFTDVDFVDRVALVLEIRGEFSAWASYERWPGRDDADVAFMVDARPVQGKGIATLLLEHLAAIARTNGIQRFTADVLADNRPMLRVFARAGWPVQRHFDSGVMELEFPLVDTELFVDSVEEREHRADSRADRPPAAPPLDRGHRRVGPGGLDRSRAVAQRVVRDAAGLPRERTTRHRRWATAPIGRCSTSTTTCGWRSSPRPPPRLPEVIDQCITKRVRGAVVVTAIDRHRRRHRRRSSPTPVATACG